MTTQIEMYGSFLEEAVYDEIKKVLRIKIGSTFYYYHGVTKIRIAKFKKAVSKGSYYCKFIKGKYETTKRKCAK